MGQLKATTSETVVLGGIMSNPCFLLDLTDLKADFFSDQVNRTLYIAMKRLFKKGAKTFDIADIYAVIETSESRIERLKRYGGIEYLEQLKIIGDGKDLSEIKIHASNIMDCAYKNEISEVLYELQMYVSQADSEKRNEINKTIEEKILQVKAKYASGHKVELISTKTDKILQQLEENKSGYIGFETSIPLLSQFVTYRKGELVIYSAKAKVGKSQLVVNEVYNMSILRGIPVMVLDTELQTKTFVIRLLARITGYSFKFIEHGEWKKYPGCIKKIKEAKELIDKAPISHTYIVGWTEDEITNEVKRMKIQYNTQVVIYDYIKIENINGKTQEHQLLGNMTNWLKNGIAGSLDMAVIALAQMSDYISEERGFKIANSEKIKNYASTVIYLVEKNQEQYSRDYEEAGGNAYLYVDYNRNGPQMKDDMQDRGINIVFQKNKAIVEQARWQLEEIEALLEDHEESFEEYISEDGEVSAEL